MLPPTISRDEFSRLFGLPLEVVDGLIDSGRVLCQIRGGEPRIPLDEIEAFFRDGLMRLFQTDAWLTRAAALEDDLTLLTTEWQEGDEPYGVPPAVEQPDTEMGTAAGGASSETDAAPPHEPSMPAVPAETSTESAPSERRSTPAGRRSGPTDRRNLRIAQRFVPRRQIDGIFDDVRFTILQLSNTGLRIRHTQPLVPGDEAKLSFALLTPPRSFVMRAKVVWTSLARFESGGSPFSISGLRVVEHVERLVAAVAVLRASHDLKPDLAAEGSDERDANAINGISDDDIALIMKAAQHFADDPLEANRWYGRARFALADERVRRDAPRLARDREEVLGIWEYLDRQIEIPKVAGVLAWMKRTKAASV